MWRTRICYPVYAQRMGTQAIVALLAGFLNIGLSYGLFPAFGKVGPAVSSVISAGVLFFGTWLLAMRLHPMPWNLKRRPETPQELSS
jgi:hypothetical protein